MQDEGCLSIPGLALSRRAARSRSRWTGRTSTAPRTASGSTAPQRCASSTSTDHLDGIVTLDRTDPQVLEPRPRRWPRCGTPMAPAAARAMIARSALSCPGPTAACAPPAAPVEAITDDIRAIWDDMIETMEAMPGSASPAPQVGVMLRLAVVDASERARPGGAAGQPRDPARLGAAARRTRRPRPTCPASGPRSSARGR